jgi:hypothetical protein
MLFRCCSNSIVAMLDLLLIYVNEHEILAQHKDQLVAPISEQAFGNLIWPSLDAPVSHRTTRWAVSSECPPTVILTVEWSFV